MPKNKPASKRVAMKVKYAVKKRVQEHDRKQRRMAKKNPSKYGKKITKDPGIPNLYPFKAQLLERSKRAIETLKATELSRQRRLQEAAKRRRLLGDAVAASAEQQDALAQMAASAAARRTDFESSAAASAASGGADEGSFVQDANAQAERQTRKAFMKHLRTVVERSDVILEVLDARDPMGCRSLDVERYILGASTKSQKRLVLVLNKIDLVPPVVAAGWLQYLRRFFPVIAFKASTQKQGSNLSAASGAGVGRATRSGEVVTGAGAAGAETLLQLVKNYSRSHGLKTAVTVGVVGYPNVGKSSLINSMRRSRVASVSPRPGCTTNMQEIVLDSKLKLLDCPGIIFSSDDSIGPDGSSDGGASLLLRNCISVDAIPDPEHAVRGILERCHPDKIAALYAIPRFATVEEFLVAIAYKRQMLGKGGAPNVQTAARAVLQDWNSGKIPFFTMPPTKEEQAAAQSEHVESAIVDGWAKEFNIDELAGEVKVEGKPDAASTKGFVALSAGHMQTMGDDSDEDLSEGGEDSDDDLTGDGAGSGAAAPKFAVGNTQRKGALSGGASSGDALSALAAGYGGASAAGAQDDGVAAQMGLGSGRSGRGKGAFLDAEEVAAGNLQVQQARRSSSKADKRKARKENRRAERGEPDAASASSGQNSAVADDTYDFKSFF